MSEEAFKNTTLKQLRKRKLHCVKHNDSFTPGIADLSVYSEEAGWTQWIELKYLRRWPKKSGMVDLGFETEQTYFLRKRNGYGLVKVGKEVLLLHARYCDNRHDQMTLRFVSDRLWVRQVDWDELVQRIF